MRLLVLSQSDTHTMFKGLKWSVLAFSYQLSHQTEEGA